MGFKTIFKDPVSNRVKWREHTVGQMTENHTARVVAEPHLHRCQHIAIPQAFPEDFRRDLKLLAERWLDRFLVWHELTDRERDRSYAVATGSASFKAASSFASSSFDSEV